MSFDDLPENWSDLPLDSPGLAADVADLVVSHRDRSGGCVGLILTGRWHQVAIDACRAGGTPLLGAFLATPSTVRAFPEAWHDVRAS